MKVTSHPDRDMLFNNGMTQSLLKTRMTATGSGALVLLSSLHTSAAIQLKYGDVFEAQPAHHLLQVWSTAKHNSNFYRTLAKLTDPTNQSALLLRYYDELFGDARATHALSQAYNQYLANQTAEVNLGIYKQGNISSAKIR
jgi:hypothetical protein